MIIENIFDTSGFDAIVAYSFKDITEKMIDDCLEIDKTFYKKEYYWNKDDVFNLVSKFGQFCFVFVDENEKRVIGYSFWFPIKTNIFKSFIKQRKMLLNLKEEFCSHFKDGDTVNLFSGGEAFIKGYDLLNLHKAIENLFQKRVLELASVGILVDYIAIEACCEYDTKYLIPLLGLTKHIQKNNSTFYIGKYNPKTTYKDSKYVNDLLKFYEK